MKIPIQRKMRKNDIYRLIFIVFDTREMKEKSYLNKFYFIVVTLIKREE